MARPALHRAFCCPALHPGNLIIKILARLLLLNTLLLSGCGTYMARVPGTYDWRDDRYYRGTKTSAQLLTGYEMGYGKILRGMCWVTVVCPVYIVVTLPADALIDTVLLPYDAVQPERPKMQPDNYDPGPVPPLTPEEIYELQHPSGH